MQSMKPNVRSRLIFTVGGRSVGAFAELVIYLLYLSYASMGKLEDGEASFPVEYKLISSVNPISLFYFYLVDAP